jgi:Fe2+ transport system protein B
MVDITGRLEEIKGLIDKRAYFNINRARQYGKTTTLTSLQKYISEWYNVVYMDFQFMSDAVFETEASFVRALAFLFAITFNMPCVSALASTAKEAHSVKWTAKIALFYTVTALCISCIVYHVGLLLFKKTQMMPI